MGILSGLLGGGSQQKQVSGFSALPKQVQDAYLNTFLPGALDWYSNNKEYQALPMKRVNAPSSPFDSQGLYDLQQYSDSVGGLFSPYGQKQQEEQSSQMQLTPDLLKGLAGLSKFSMPYGLGKTTKGDINGMGTIDSYIQMLLGGGGK